MSNPQSRCREAHGGKFTRPRKQWKGRIRNARANVRAAEMNNRVASISKVMNSVTRKFQLPANKRGD